MSLLFGYLTLACFILLAVKYPLRIAGAHKANALLMKLHEAASGLFFLAAIVHMITGFSLISANSAVLTIAGFAAFIISVVLITACHLTKDMKKKMYWHRWYSLLMTAAVIVHIVLAWV